LVAFRVEASALEGPVVASAAPRCDDFEELVFVVEDHGAFSSAFHKVTFETLLKSLQMAKLTPLTTVHFENGGEEFKKVTSLKHGCYPTVMIPSRCRDGAVRA
jgi:hypothetical protein